MKAIVFPIKTLWGSIKTTVSCKLSYKFGGTLISAIMLIYGVLVIPIYTQYKNHTLLDLKNTAQNTVHALNRTGHLQSQAKRWFQNQTHPDPTHNPIKGLYLFSIKTNQIIGAYGAPLDILPGSPASFDSIAQKISQPGYTERQTLYFAWPAPIFKTPYHILLSVDTTATMAGIHQLFFNITLCVFAIALAISFLGMLVLKKIVLSPLLTLNNKASALAHDPEHAEHYYIHTDDEYHQKNQNHEDEIETLIHSFDEVLNHIVQDNLKLRALVTEKTTLAHYAYHDLLTELPNRRYFIEHLEKTIAHAARDQTKTALFMIDIDEFKSINDRFGHHFGDQVLQVIAQRITHKLRDHIECIQLSRQGGDEFVLLVSDLKNHTTCQKIAQRVLEAFQDPIHLDHQSVQITASIGIALFPDHAQTPQILLKDADKAMYTAKQNGKNQVVFFPTQGLTAHSPNTLSH
jgi:diguanylate cyclase (GGDEF)-like protein